MFKKIFDIVLLVFLTITFIGSLESIYRATLKAPDMTTIIGKVTEKNILYFTSKTGRTYCLAFKLNNRKDKIAINLGTESQAQKDSTFYLIDTGKTYKFYLDPTVLTDDGTNWGITQIDYNGYRIYKTSNKLNLYGGLFTGLISLIVFIIIIKFKKKENRS